MCAGTSETVPERVSAAFQKLTLEQKTITVYKFLVNNEENSMKEGIHPKVYKAKIQCACGFEVEALSSKGEVVHTEICSNCHPFYTGKQRFVDTAGRIDRFRKKYAKFENK